MAVRNQSSNTAPTFSGDAIPDSEETELLRGRLERLEREFARVSGEREQLAKALNEILQSASWRLTDPLRKVMAWRRRIIGTLFPIWRTGKFSIVTKIVRHLEEHTLPSGGGFLRIIAANAVLALQPSRKPTGWVMLEGTLSHKEGHGFFYLHYPTGGTVNDRERALLPWVSGPVPNRTVVRLPQGYGELSIEPIESEGEFALSNLSVSELGSLQVLWALVERHVRTLWEDPGKFLVKLQKAWAVYKEGGITALRIKLLANHITADYQEWVRRYDTLNDTDRSQIRARIATLSYQPLISIVMPVYNVDEQYLQAAINSVRAQLYTNWQLCIADDASTAPHVRKVLEGAMQQDPRISVVFCPVNGHISKASNAALELAKGEFVALLDNDDELTEHALYLVVEQLNKNRELDFIYSDEDKKTSFGLRFNPYFKSGWNPDLLLAQNYLCHLCVYRTAVMRQVGGFRVGFEGAQDWDLALRVTDAIAENRIAHIPHVLYHWRVIEGSTAQSTSHKPYVLEAQKRSVAEHLERRGVRGAKVEILESIAQLRVTLPIPTPEPLVSIIIPTKDKVSLLKRCVESIIARSTYQNFEILIVDNNSVEPETFTYFEGLRNFAQVRVIKDPKPFNYSRINNQAVKEAKGELLGFLNNDLEVINPDWLREMVSHAVRPEVGAVGARLLFPNNLVQHGGVILGIGGVAGHSHKGQLRENPGYFNRAILTQDLSAVTAACMLMRREVFDRSGGFDEGTLAVAFNDVDLCLKVRQLGLRVVYAPRAELYHFESASRGHETTPEKFQRFEREVEAMKSRWGAVLANDPYYNPNLSVLTEDFAFAFPPRAEKVWRN